MSSPDYSQSQLAQTNAQVQGMHSEMARLARRVTILEHQGSYGTPDLPKSQIFSPKFLTRAFAIYGHVFVANLVIVVAIYAVLFLLMLILGVTLGDWF